jgi:signal transduction histidine kinase
LISNAIKYNLPSNGWIQISAEVQDKKLHIRVSNSGEDISMDEQTRIFDRFYRARRKTVIHGSGLGLSLAREIIRAHHGEIQLIKSANEMTEFELIFPVKNEA